MYERTDGPSKLADYDAFAYACHSCLHDRLLATGFMEMAKEAETIEGFASDLVEWVYSGAWTHSKPQEDEQERLSFCKHIDDCKSAYAWED